VNAEIKRSTKVVAAFPSGESLLCLIGLILTDLSGDWITGCRYLNMAGVPARHSSDVEPGFCTPQKIPIVSIVDL